MSLMPKQPTKMEPLSPDESNQGVKTQSWWSFCLPSLMPKPAIICVSTPCCAHHGRVLPSLSVALASVTLTRMCFFKSALFCLAALISECQIKIPRHYVYSQNIGDLRRMQISLLQFFKTFLIQGGASEWRVHSH